MALDRVDRRLLRLLQSNGRLTNAELAKKVNVSPPGQSGRVLPVLDR
jgi:Lrp/AsnC family transcriptional regulator, leucine-responsive regulatory protein